MDEYSVLQQNVTNFVFAATSKKKVKPATNATVIPKEKLTVRAVLAAPISIDMQALAQIHLPIFSVAFVCTDLHNQQPTTLECNRSCVP